MYNFITLFLSGNVTEIATVTEIAIVTGVSAKEKIVTETVIASEESVTVLRSVIETVVIDVKDAVGHARKTVTGKAVYLCSIKMLLPLHQN